jgi:hypothetical protein
MPRLRNKVLAGVAVAAVACLPSAPAVAGGPLLFAPWALSHIVAPLIIGAALSSLQPQAPYPAGPGYYGGAAGYYAPPNYVQPPGYYAPSRGYYPRGYYGSSSYSQATPRAYPYPRGVYPQRLPYHASYGGHEAYRSGGYGHHRW